MIFKKKISKKKIKNKLKIKNQLLHHKRIMFKSNKKIFNCKQKNKKKELNILKIKLKNINFNTIK